VLKLPVVLELSAPVPLKPVLLKRSAKVPLAVLSSPVVLE
jgi:hypothetical protein